MTIPIMISSANLKAPSTSLLSPTGKFQLLDDMLPKIRGRGDRVLIFSQVERWNIQFVVGLRLFSAVHHVARRVGEVLEDQRTQVHAAGWADAGAGEE